MLPMHRQAETRPVGRVFAEFTVSFDGVVRLYKKLLRYLPCPTMTGTTMSSHLLI